jgi:Protein of unknown function (DUF3108)
MPLRLPVLRSAALAVALSAAAVPARAYQASYDFTIAGITVGAMVLGGEQTGDSYTATGRIDTAGIVSMFADFYFDGRANGTVRSDGTVVPEHYKGTSQSPRALRHTVIDWKGGVPSKVSIDPPRKINADPAKQGDALDPVSATFRMFRDAPPDRICDDTVFIFDGSRRSRLFFNPPVADGNRLTCTGTYSRLEGEANSIADLQEFPFTVTFTLNKDGIAQLQRIEAPTNFGTAVIKRRS